MRAVVQRVSEASVIVQGQVISQMGAGLLVLLGVEKGDTSEDRTWLARKITNLRIFGDEEGKMNRSLVETKGGVIVVSQFTLLAATRKGNRPSYIRAAVPEEAIPGYEAFVAEMELLLGKSVGTGSFGADMKVHLVNDGPVTIWIDSRRRDL